MGQASISDVRKKGSGALEPAPDVLAITPGTNNIPSGSIARAVYVGGAGTLSLITVEGTVISATAVCPGVVPIQCTSIGATGDTATGVLALY